MTLKDLNDFGREAAPLIANHLWQSTLFAVLAGVLTLALRENHARIRYGLWLAASLKFLLPFSLLISLGQLVWPHGTARVQTAVYYAVEISQPFVQSAVHTAAPVTRAAYLLSLLPAGLAVLWLCGFVAALSLWWVRWWRVSRAMRDAVPMTEGREVDVLREVERIGGLHRSIGFRLSQSSLEPGVFGIVRPVMVWPARISEHLQDAHLRAILAHEVWHVRRRDNLAAAVHMLVEALFWFHPLVWWLGARLVEERECACDEAVLELGSERVIYAESILKACEFCMESPLFCVSGVTGSNLKKRIVRIMTQRMADKLTFGRKMLLASIGMTAVAVPVVVGLMDAPRVIAESPQGNSMAPAAYEVVSFKPNRSGEKTQQMQLFPGGVKGTNATVKSLIGFAFDVKEYQLTGGPNWIDTERYDFEIKQKGLPEPSTAGPVPVPLTQMEPIRMVVQGMLAERFNLKLSHETKEEPVYALVVADGGAKLTEAAEPTIVPDIGQGPQEKIVAMKTMVKDDSGGGRMMMTGPMKSLAEHLSGPLGRQVIDETGLEGNYTMTLQWTSGADRVDSISKALEEQFGLKLVPQQGAVTITVIDQIEMPTGS